MSAYRAPAPFAVSRVDQLVDAWRIADARYGLLTDRRSLLARLLLLLSLPAVTVLLAALTGSPAQAALRLDLLVLTLAGLHAGLVEVADAKVARTWYALRDYTGLSDEGLLFLVRDDDEIEIEIEEVA
jgi:hypothetical protein